MKATKTQIVRLSHLMLLIPIFLSVGCGGSNEPVRSAGSIDIPQDALKKFSEVKTAPKKSANSISSRPSRTR